MKTFHRTNVSSKTYQIIGSRLKCEHTQIKEICSACSTQNRCKYMNALAIQEEGNNITHLLPQCSELDEKCDSLDNMDQSKAGEQVKAKATEIYNNWQTYKQISKQMKQN
uniref:Phlebovirus glycoprotein G2 fusion domain-containing protein n=1 Tax=Rhabditophanes sp. KR3021 TaxID=114890 RepID=A0AC35U290_9BILA